MQLKRAMSDAALELRQIVREIELLKNLKHPAIVELKEVFLSAPKFLGYLFPAPPSGAFFAFCQRGT